MHTKKPSVSMEFLDALANIIADRVATKLSEASKSPPEPREVPLWVPGPKGRRTKPALPAGRKWTPEVALREAGMLTIGDPGYQEALGPYLDRIRAYEAERAREGRMRQMVRFLDELLAPTKQAPHEAVPAGMTVWVKAEEVARSRRRTSTCARRRGARSERAGSSGSPSMSGKRGRETT
jgi:hypothetical protein